MIHFSNVPTDRRYRPIESGAPVPLSPQAVEGTIARVAMRYRVDPALIKAVIKVESDFDPRAVSASGAMGLMQLMPATVEQHRVADPFDPDQNIRGGGRHLGLLLSRFTGNLSLTLAAYHAGPETVARYHNHIPPIEQTQRYVKKVLAAYKKYRAMNPARKRVYRALARDGTVVSTNAPEQYPAARAYQVAYVR